jgi:hypothetical protein
MRALVGQVGVARLAELLPVPRPVLSRWLPEFADADEKATATAVGGSVSAGDAASPHAVGQH